MASWLPLAAAALTAVAGGGRSSARGGGAGVVELPITRRLTPGGGGGDPSARAAPGSKSDYDRRGDVAIRPDGGIQYVCTVNIGTPAQPVSLILDTGSSDVLVAGGSYACHAGSKSKNCDTHHVFRETASSTYKRDAAGGSLRVHEKYQAGIVDGEAASDRVTWGGYSTRWVHFGVLQAESKAIEFARADGVLGMAFVGLSKVTRPPLFAQLVQERQDSLGGARNMFSLFIAPGLAATGSRLILGGYDLSLAGRDAVWHYTPVIKLHGYEEYTYWALKLTSMALKWGDGLSMDVCHTRSGCQAIVDSGGWGIGVPARYYKRFVDMVTDNHDDCSFVHGGEQVYCKQCFLSKFPTLYFSAPPDNTFALRPGDFVIDRHGHNAQRGYRHAEGDPCWLTFMTADKAGNQEVFVLGDTFLSTYYTLFDAANMRIGLACDKHDTCNGGKHGATAIGRSREGVRQSRVHEARQVGGMFAFSAFCLYIFWLGEKRRARVIDFETDSFGGGASGGWGGSHAGGYSRVGGSADAGISLTDLHSGPAHGAGAGVGAGAGAGGHRSVLGSAYQGEALGEVGLHAGGGLTAREGDGEYYGGGAYEAGDDDEAPPEL
eukprot:g3489.t1